MDIIYKSAIEQAIRTNEDFYRFTQHLKKPVEKYNPEELENMFNKYLLGE